MATHRPFLGTFAIDDAGQWERESGLVAVYEAAPRDSWTTDSPTHPGSWHVRLPGDDRCIVVQVERDHVGRLVWGLPKVDWTPVRGADVEWGSRAVRSPE